MSCCDGGAIHELYHHRLNLNAMYHLLSGLHSYLTRKDEYSVVIIGLDNVRNLSQQARMTRADGSRQERRYVRCRAPVTEFCAWDERVRQPGAAPNTGFRRGKDHWHRGADSPPPLRRAVLLSTWCWPQTAFAPSRTVMWARGTRDQPHVSAFKGAVPVCRCAGGLPCPRRCSHHDGPDGRQCWKRSRPSTTPRRVWHRTRLRQR